MFKLFRLALLRSLERFFAQWIFVSTQPRAFARECIRLGDTTNFIRASKFFVSAISSAFLAEVATLHLLGIGNVAEPYYWLFILLNAIPFVVFCFLLVRLVGAYCTGLQCPEASAAMASSQCLPSKGFTVTSRKAPSSRQRTFTLKPSGRERGT